MTNYRVWWVRNPPNPPDFYQVTTPHEGAEKLQALTTADLRASWVVSNAGGLEVFEDGEWTEWYDDQGRDVDNAFINPQEE